MATVLRGEPGFGRYIWIELALVPPIMAMDRVGCKD